MACGQGRGPRCAVSSCDPVPPGGGTDSPQQQHGHLTSFGLSSSRTLHGVLVLLRRSPSHGRPRKISRGRPPPVLMTALHVQGLDVRICGTMTHATCEALIQCRVGISTGCPETQGHHNTHRGAGTAPHRPCNLHALLLLQVATNAGQQSSGRHHCTHILSQGHRGPAGPGPLPNRRGKCTPQLRACSVLWAGAAPTESCPRLITIIHNTEPQLTCYLVHIRSLTSHSQASGAHPGVATTEPTAHMHPRLLLPTSPRPKMLLYKPMYDATSTMLQLIA